VGIASNERQQSPPTVGGKQEQSDFSWALACANNRPPQILTLDFQLNDQQGMTLNRMNDAGFQR
jgi:hypothetical protein